ncbi:pilus assembly PilX family protein [Ostreibacterium oceani]|uniref:Uncharacterized protein n=1 Tax=Ostreibacterium oceani TaxID=2654998 RepID=A0A6N7ETJ6_9GAMM|nr:hypothetical protein [Ostreibacterium oceani]MPV85263.1 hypothetical protein [Ostreibacterium oceani]
MKKINKNFSMPKQQQGIVLFVAMVMVLILASLTVTTAQVTRQATKFAQINDSRIRADLANQSVVRDVETTLDILRAKINPPASNNGGGGVGWATLSAKSAESTLQLPATDKPMTEYFSTLIGLPALTGAFVPDNTSLACADGVPLNLRLGQVSAADAVSGVVDFSVNTEGHCRPFLRDRPLILSGGGSKVGTTFTTANNLASWFSLAWVDFESSVACQGGACVASGKIGDNNILLRNQVGNVYQQSFDDIGAVDDNIHDYKNFIGQANLPEYMLETTTRNESTGAGAGTEELMITNTGSGSSGSDPVVYIHRITGTGYGGFIESDEPNVNDRTRSNFMTRAIRFSIE